MYFSMPIFLFEFFEFSLTDMHLLHLYAYDFLWSIRDEGSIFELYLYTSYIIFLIFYFFSESISFFFEFFFIEGSIDIYFYTISDSIGVADSLDRPLFESESRDAGKSSHKRYICLYRLSIDFWNYEDDISGFTRLDP